MTASAPIRASIPTLREAVSYLLRLLMLVRPYWGGLLRTVALGTLVGLLGLVPPYVSKLYFDEVYPARDLSFLHFLVLGAAAFALATAIVGGLRTYYSQIVANQLSSAVGLMYFNHIQHLPAAFFEERRVGEILSRMTDMRSALGTASKAFQVLVMNGVYFILVPPFLLMLSPKLALIALIATPITTTITTATSRVSRKHMKRSAEATADLRAVQVEALSHIRTVKALAAERAFFLDARHRTEEALEHQLRASGIGALVGALSATVRAATTALYTWYAWTLIIHGELSLGAFVAFSGYLGYLTGPVGQVAGLFSDFQQTTVTLGRAFEYLDVPGEQNPEHVFAPPHSPSRCIVGRIEINDLSFGYAANKAVLSNVTMTFEPMTATAIVGESGAGKSTILKLLCRMAEPQRGSVRIDGIDLDRIPHEELRTQLAVVWQDPVLFRGTIWDNLTLGLSDVTRDEVDAAIETCQLVDVIRDLPCRYETTVAEWGATLSGGQRQRFVVARALLRRAPILLLDEATSQVDVTSEARLLDALLRHDRRATVIMITHRVTSAALADYVYVLEGGRVVAAGHHDDLVRSSVEFRSMLSTARGQGETQAVRLAIST